MKLVSLFVLALAFTFSPLFVKNIQAQEASSDIVELAVEAGDFGTLVAAVDAAGLADTLKGDGPFTVFAPTDEAFAALPAGTVEALLQDPEGALTDILLYHVVAGKLMAADVIALDGAEVETVGGSSVTISVDGTNVLVNDANVIQTDVEAANGVIHVIDAVLIPSTAAVPAADSAVVPAADRNLDIVDTAIEAGNFSTLFAFLQAAKLEGVLRSQGPFTVFAPTDEAFAAIPAELLESLLANPEGTLADILLYHVVPGEILVADVAGLNGAEVESVGGEPLVVTLEGDTVKINDANVIATDILASNGVIHVIDSVLLPPSVLAALQSSAPVQTEPEPTGKYNIAKPSKPNHAKEGHSSMGRQQKWRHNHGYRGAYCR